MFRFSKLLTLAALLAMLLSACGGGQATLPPATQPPATEAMTEAPTEAATEAPTEAATTAPATGEIDCAGAQSGDEVTLLYQWAAQEEERWNQIIKPVVDACGIVLKPTSSRDQALLDTQVQAGTPPDIAFYNVTQLVQYKDKLVPVDQLGASKDAYIPVFHRHTSHNRVVTRSLHRLDHEHVLVDVDLDPRRVEVEAAVRAVRVVAGRVGVVRPRGKAIEGNLLGGAEVRSEPDLPGSIKRCDRRLRVPFGTNSDGALELARAKAAAIPEMSADYRPFDRFPSMPAHRGCDCTISAG